MIPMTNKQKAFELSSINRYGFSVEESNAAYNAALEMAEWKDQQFKTKIEELFNELEKEGYNDRVKSGFEIFKDKII